MRAEKRLSEDELLLVKQIILKEAKKYESILS